MTSEENEKSCASNLLASIKQLMMASSMLVSLMLSGFTLPFGSNKKISKMM